MEKKFQLSTTLFGHTGDVRALASFADGTIVSGSRDKTARVWKPRGDGTGYVESAILKGHSNFVSSVCVINPLKEYPQGLIITGSNDSTICVYVVNETEPIHVIKSHKDTVCCLRTGKCEGTFLSSSWDLSAKVWSLDNLSKPQLNLTGHTAAVWCIAELANGLIVTGSADKLVIVWSKTGSVLHKLTGHTDCVRDIVAIKDNEFLTCSNDATVRHWNASSGTALETYSAHENYIYSITAVPNGTYVYTAGEDRTIRIWYNAESSGVIFLPTQSVWCIDLLSNGDIAAGSSDGVIRIFSANPERYADAQTLEEFQKQVENSNLSAQEVLGGIKVKDLPDASALQQPGQRDGQTKMVKEGDRVKAYNWSQDQQQWVLIGDVMGASGGSSATSGKQLYNGKEYDYVFSVDIQDGVPPLKLPYNNGEDPWHAAQKFLNDNGLSQLFLDQVANFIMKNSQPAPVLNANPAYADPFTGGNRYIPSGGTSHNTPNNSGKTSTFASSSSSSSPSYIPHSKYLKLEQANLPAILNKLRELNSKQQTVSKVPEDKLDAVIKLAGDEAAKHTREIDVLRALLQWSNETVFPVLDVARLAVLRKEVNDHLCTDELLQVIRRHIKPDSIAANQMLTFRLLANMFNHDKGEQLGLFCKDEVLKALLDLQSLGSKHNQVAVSTYILNLTIALNKCNDMPGKTKTMNVIFAVLPRLNETEAIFRILVSLGTLVAVTSNANDRNELIGTVRQSETVLDVLKATSETSETNTSDKVITCCKQIIDLIL